MQRPHPESRDPVPAAARGPFAGLAISHRADRATGRLALEAAHLGGGGQVHAGTLFGLAADVAGALALARAGADQVARLVDVKTIVLAPGAARSLTAEGQGHPGDPTGTVWLVDVRCDAGHVLASIAHRFELMPTAPGADLPRTTDAPGAPKPPHPPAAEPSLADQRRARIARAAGEVIGRKGFANATMREIADAAGLHVPTMYQHLTSKDEVLELVYMQAMERIAAGMDARATETQDPVAALTEAFSMLLAISDEYRRDVGVLNREFKSLQPDARRRVIAMYRELIERFGDPVARGIRHRQFRETDPFLVGNYIEMMADIWALRPFFLAGYSLEEYRRVSIEFMLYGLAGRPGPGSRTD